MRRKTARRTPRIPKTIQKAPTGIEGVDQITRGGLPRGGLTLVVGTAGAGKTVFGLQTLVNGARQFGEAGICVAFEERSNQLVGNTESFGWDLRALMRKRGRRGPLLTLIDGQVSSESVQAGAFDLNGLLATVEHNARTTGARRVLFDGIDVLLGLLPDARTQRQEMYRVREFLERTSLTGIVTASIMEPQATTGFMLSLSDCVIHLTNRLVDRTSQRAFQVVKYRGSRFTANEVPLAITDTGIEVANFGFEPDYPVSRERVSSGIPALDVMLRGGYFRGSAVLVSGPPGSGKTTLAGSFVAAACARGDRAIYVTLDEHPRQVIRNLRSVNIKLETFVGSGMLHMYSDLSQSTSPEEQFIRVQREIRDRQPRVLVVDPLSAITKMGGQLGALGIAQRLLELAKSKGITTLWTSLNDGSGEILPGTRLMVSSVADTWINLANRPGRGERNRTLTIMKSRGTGHSTHVGELVFTDQGIDLTDVYTAGGEVLMGAARVAREAADVAASTRAVATSGRRRRALEDTAVETRSQIEQLAKKLERLADEIRQAELDNARAEERVRRPSRQRKNARK